MKKLFGNDKKYVFQYTDERKVVETEDFHLTSQNTNENCKQDEVPPLLG